MPDPQIPQKPGAPAVAPAPSKEPVIRTMPERYIGAPAGRPPVVREIVETRVVQPPPPVAPPPLRQGAAGQAPVKHTKRNVIIASIIVLLAGAAAVAYILLTPVGNAPPPPPVNVNVNVPIENANVNIPPPPPENANANANANENANANVNAPPPPPNTGIDSDSDGLTDAEETTIYGTDPHKLDTDGDSFNDGNEVAHLYDPTKKAPALLKDSKAVSVVENATEGYSVIVPAKWLASGENTAQFIVTAPTNEFFEVLETDKPASQSLVEWYLSMSPGAQATDVERFKTLQGYDALRSPDRLTTYIDAGDGRLFTLTYSYDSQTSLEFRTTYEAFIASFTLAKK